ncbi:hypothetical protein BZA05DRAFT_421728 [Tricharina praecox]|uniref:uncharacterized protein n=1 Tax=Tricharina praecox TaxID=43433 RepID=UPI0022200BDC|nr:uncharacterized protein BZA05DRAFT_421728 [Tricharina praecox]KAI5844801.1 hypothetical protein BZA05DRAFT_421728 [Tricharina praecox]
MSALGGVQGYGPSSGHGEIDESEQEPPSSQQRYGYNSDDSDNDLMYEATYSIDEEAETETEGEAEEDAEGEEELEGETQGEAMKDGDIKLLAKVERAKPMQKAIQVRKAAGDSARPYPELVIPPTVRRNKIDPMERLRMSPVENPEAQNPKAGKGTWLRRRMGIPSGIPLRDQNRAATALYTKVRTLSKQELDRPYTWYSTQGLTTDMINRVVAGMYKYSWDKRLARDVMMSICQRRCQNINRRENRARRAAGEEIKLGRRKTDYSATYDDPMDFVPTMKAPTYNDPNDKLIANMKDLPVNDPTDEILANLRAPIYKDPTDKLIANMRALPENDPIDKILPNFRALPDNSPITTSAKQRKANSVDKILPNYRALPDNSPITWSAKQRGAKMGPIPYTATSQRKGRIDKKKTPRALPPSPHVPGRRIAGPDHVAPSSADRKPLNTSTVSILVAADDYDLFMQAIAKGQVRHTNGMINITLTLENKQSTGSDPEGDEGIQVHSSSAQPVTDSPVIRKRKPNGKAMEVAETETQDRGTSQTLVPRYPSHTLKRVSSEEDSAKARGNKRIVKPTN